MTFLEACYSEALPAAECVPAYQFVAILIGGILAVGLLVALILRRRSSQGTPPTGKARSIGRNDK